MIRKVYIDLARRKVREYGMSWLLKRTLQYAGIQMGRLVNRPLCGPVLGTLLVTYRCNLHCEMCDLPLVANEQAQAGRQELGTRDMKEIVNGFARLGTPGIGFTGGEPLLRDDIYELLAYVRQSGMISHLNTNGTLVGEKEAREIIAAGVDSVNVSLDGSSAATHDRIRQRTGTFDMAVAALSNLISQRRKMGSNVLVKAVAVIAPSTVNEMPKLAALAGKLGIDRIKFIPRQPFIRQEQETGSVLERGVAYLHDFEDALRRLAEHKDIIENSPTHLKLFPQAFAGEPSPVRCSASFNSLVADCYGDIFPCVPWINWRRSVGNVSSMGLDTFWYSEGYRQLRNEVGQCQGCHLNCHSELNMLFDAGRMISALKLTI
jgi:MoaA/NifB/PqqE/SkfB family radical SAM enzyme